MILEILGPIIVVLFFVGLGIAIVRQQYIAIGRPQPAIYLRGRNAVVFGVILILIGIIGGVLFLLSGLWALIH